MEVRVVPLFGGKMMAALTEKDTSIRYNDPHLEKSLKAASKGLGLKPNWWFFSLGFTNVITDEFDFTSDSQEWASTTQPQSDIAGVMRTRQKSDGVILKPHSRHPIIASIADTMWGVFYTTPDGEGNRRWGILHLGLWGPLVHRDHDPIMAELASRCEGLEVEVEEFWAGFGVSSAYYGLRTDDTRWPKIHEWQDGSLKTTDGTRKDQPAVDMREIIRRQSRKFLGVEAQIDDTCNVASGRHWSGSQGDGLARNLALAWIPEGSPLLAT